MARVSTLIPSGEVFDSCRAHPSWPPPRVFARGQARGGHDERARRVILFAAWYYLPADIRAALLKADEAILREDRFDDKAFIMAITKNDEFRSKLEQIANSDRLPENQRRILWNILKSRYDAPTFDIGGLNYDIIWAAFDEERRDTALQRLRGGGPKTALQRLQDLKGANHNEATGADSGKQ